ncbi:hypothetical protein ACT8ZV_05045 [Nocardioides sp. MAHUQ-72]|uniref:hypothetical protein n=1 Tax=unclassified Nocardioides TaxID=2615069 RepID=UPI00361F1731
MTTHVTHRHRWAWHGPGGHGLEWRTLLRTGPLPQALHRRARRRAASAPTFGERRPVAGVMITVCWLVAIGVLVGTVLGKVLALTVHEVLVLVAPGSGS